MAKSYPSTSSQVQGIVKAPSEKKKWERKKTSRLVWPRTHRLYRLMSLQAVPSPVAFLASIKAVCGVAVRVCRLN